MERKITAACTREELADHLERLAEQLRKGNLPVGTETLPVPETVDMKWNFKEKKHHVACKLEWRWSTREHLKSRDDPTQAGELLQPGFKLIKKDLARLFRSLKQAVIRGMLPDGHLLEEFVRLSRAFVDQAEPEWERAGREYLGHVENLLGAIRDGRKEAMLHEIQDIQARMMACHKEFA